MSKVYINMHISGLVSAAALASFMGQVEQEGPSSDEPQPEPVSEKPKPARTTKAKEEPAAEQPEVEQSDVPSIDDVKAAAQALVAANGREALAELLSEYDAKNLSSVPEDKRADFISAIETKTAK
jgi:hypothetical protein